MSDAPPATQDANAAADDNATADDWAATPLRALRARLKVLRAFRFALADHVDELADLVRGPNRRPADTVAAEVLPLLAAVRFLEKRAASILKPRRLGLLGRPNWLWGVRGRVARRPLGDVLILGTWNYPLFLTGCQLVQALAAGNRVQIKPGQGSTAVAQRLVELLDASGLPNGVARVLPETTQAAQRAMALGVDLVVLTGSSRTAAAVLKQAAASLTPCIIEASGCDAVVVRPGANLKLVADALAFGMRFSGSATCIAPRRVFVPRDQLDLLASTLEWKFGPMRVQPNGPAWLHAVEAASRSGGSLPEACGKVFDLEPNAAATTDLKDATDSEHAAGFAVSPLLVVSPDRQSELVQADLFAPVVSLLPYDGDADLSAAMRHCPYALGASVFGPRRDAEAIAAALPAGCVCVNDVIVPTADPRVPFGGTGRSGFGVTRGAEGLLAMTRPHVVMTRTGNWRPHLDAPHPQDRDLLAGLAEYGYRRGWSGRMAGLRRLIKAAKR